MTAKKDSKAPEWTVFIAGLASIGDSQESEIARLSDIWPAAEQAATDASRRLPPVGWVSFRKPFMAFVTISRYLDELQQARELTDEQVQLALTILRLRSSQYGRAERIFAARVHRLSSTDREGLPHTARQFLLALARL